MDFAAGNLRLGYQVLAMGIVDFLLRDQARLLFGHVRQPGISQVRNLMRGFGLLDLVLGARYLRLAAIYRLPAP